MNAENMFLLRGLGAVVLFAGRPIARGFCVFLLDAVLVFQLAVCAGWQLLAFGPLVYEQESFVISVP